jgi:beta-glucanase (GH16 family)
MSEIYKQVWSDEFDYNGAPDPEKWSFEIGHGHHGWGNNEAQYYTDAPGNCRVEDGRLIITADRSGDRITSARIHSYGHQSWTYGRFEFRAKLPTGPGTWPAVWMLGDSIHNGGSWPLCGEIDFMEHIGRKAGQVHFSLHSASHNHNKKNQETSFHQIDGILEGFHTYRMDWTPEGFSFYIDNEFYASFVKGSKDGVEEWPFDQPHHLIINLAIGGYWGGEYSDDIFPARFELEYVRVFQKES